MVLLSPFIFRYPFNRLCVAGYIPNLYLQALQLDLRPSVYSEKSFLLESHTTNFSADCQFSYGICTGV